MLVVRGSGLACLNCCGARGIGKRQIVVYSLEGVLLELRPLDCNMQDVSEVSARLSSIGAVNESGRSRGATGRAGVRARSDFDYSDIFSCFFPSTSCAVVVPLVNNSSGISREYHDACVMLQIVGTDAFLVAGAGLTLSRGDGSFDTFDGDTRHDAVAVMPGGGVIAIAGTRIRVRGILSHDGVTS